MLTTNLLFVNCGGARTSDTGGEDSNGPDGGGTDNGALEDISVLSGSWIMNRCSATSPTQALRHVYQFGATGVENRLYHHSNPRLYTNNTCTSGGTHLGATNFGVIDFKSTLTYGTRKFYKGTWSAPSGTVQKMIYAFKTPTLICIFTDTSSSFNSAASISAYVDIINELDCFTKVP